MKKKHTTLFFLFVHLESEAFLYFFRARVGMEAHATGRVVAVGYPFIPDENVCKEIAKEIAKSIHGEIIDELLLDRSISRTKRKRTQETDTTPEKRPCVTATTLSDIPIEVLHIIFLSVPPWSWKAVQRTCITWRGAIDFLRTSSRSKHSPYGHYMIEDPLFPRQRLCRYVRDASDVTLKFCRWLCDAGGRCDTQTFAYAAAKGLIDVMEWLDGFHCQWNGLAYMFAAKYGQFDALKWLYDHQIDTTKGGFPSWDHRTFDYAARNGDLVMLVWLLDTGCPTWSRLAYTFAAGQGHLETLKFLHRQFCAAPSKVPRMGSSAISNAAMNGHLDVVKWLHANGCPWDTHVCIAAASHKHDAVLQWLVARGCPWDGTTYEPSD